MCILYEAGGTDKWRANKILKSVADQRNMALAHFIRSKGESNESAYSRADARGVQTAWAGGTDMMDMRLKNGDVYRLRENGAVVDVNNRGTWEYFGKWVILGFGKRYHSRHIISLEDTLKGADTGQGWVHDLDHGTHRIWASPTNRRLESLTLVS